MALLHSESASTVIPVALFKWLGRRQVWLRVHFNHYTCCEVHLWNLLRSYQFEARTQIPSEEGVPLSEMNQTDWCTITFTQPSYQSYLHILLSVIWKSSLISISFLLPSCLHVVSSSAPLSIRTYMEQPYQQVSESSRLMLIERSPRAVLPRH